MPASLQTLIRCLPYPACVTEPGGAVTCVSRHWSQIFGDTAWEGVSVFDLLPNAAGLQAMRETMSTEISAGVLQTSFVAEIEGANAPSYRVHLGSFAGAKQGQALYVFEPIDNNAWLQQELGKRDEMIRQVRGLRHEMNNSLMGVMGHTELLEQNAPDEKVKIRAEGILGLVRRTEQLLKKLGQVIQDD